MASSTLERRDSILLQVLEKGHVTVKNLAVDLTVSEATVRRDLRALADQNQLELVYGGASLPRITDFSLHSKAHRNVEAKSVIGRLAAQLVDDNEQLFVDSGTTCFAMIHYLKRKHGLSVIVNSARVAVELGNHPDLNVIQLGGHYRPERMDSIGPLAVSTLDQLRGYITFIGADGLRMDFGPAACDVESAHLYRLAVRNGKETILLVDHTKFQTPSLFKIVEWEAISRIVTDQLPQPEWMDFLEAQGIEVIYPVEKSENEIRIHAAESTETMISK